MNTQHEFDAQPEDAEYSSLFTPSDDDTAYENGAQPNCPNCPKSAGNDDRPDESNKVTPLIDTLPAYEVTEARLINRILEHNCGFEIQLQEGDFELAFIFRQRACRANVLFTLSVGDIVFAIGLERCLFSNLENVEQLHDLPKEIRNLYFEVLLEDTCERLEAWAGLPVRILGFGPEMETNASDLRLRLDFQMMRLSDGHLSPGFVMTSGEGLRMISEFMATLPSAQLHEFNDLTLMTRVEIGKKRLKISDFKQIETRDIILIDTGDSETGELPCHLYPAARHYLKAVWHRNENRIVIVSDIKEGFMSSFDEDPEYNDHDSDSIDQKNAETRETADAMDDLPIEVTFDIGSIPMTLGELKCLREGFILETARSEYDPVRIRVNGKVIGSGELVRLSRRMGIRVLEMAAGVKHSH